MSYRMSYKISPRKRLHEKSPTPPREDGEIRNSDDDNSRHNSTSHSYSNNNKKSKYFNKYRDQKPESDAAEFSVEKCITKMIEKEIERNKMEKVEENDKIKNDIKKLKEENLAIFSEFNEIKLKMKKVEKDMTIYINNQLIKSSEKNDNIDKKIESMKNDIKKEMILEFSKIIEDKITVGIEAALKQQSISKTENLNTTVESGKVTIFDQNGRNNNDEIINISNSNDIKHGIEEVVKEQKVSETQKTLISYKDVRIPDFTSSPKWLISEEKCNELFKFCQGQVANFLTEYIPLLYDLPEIISPLKRGYKKEEAQAVIIHFWKGSLSIDLISKEVEKEHAAQRYKTSRKIYLGLKNSDGIIMSNKGAIFECRWNDEKQKFVPKSESLDDESDAILEWQLPKDLKKEEFEKNGKDYIIVAKNDDSNQTRICKIDLFNFDTKLLYTKRKYGNT